MRGYDFSKLTPEWQAFIESPAIERIIAQMAHKYLRDAGLREDAKQEARIGLATVDTSTIKGDPTKYAANVIRNSILSMATSYNTGDWYSGRTLPAKDRATGTMRKVRYPTRYASLDMLTNEYGLEIAEDHSISWEGMDDDGLQGLAPLADDTTEDAMLSDSAQHHSAEVSSPSDTEDALVDALDYEASLATLSDVDRALVEKIITGYTLREASPAINNYQVRKWRERMANVFGVVHSPSITHGKASAYSYGGCRCEDCTAAYTSYNRTRHAKRRLRQRAESALVQHRLRTRAESALARMLNAA